MTIYTQRQRESEITYVKLRLWDLPAAGSIYSLWRWSSVGRPHCSLMLLYPSGRVEGLPMESQHCLYNPVHKTLWIHLILSGGSTILQS